MASNLKMKNQKPGSNFIYLLIIALVASGIFLIMNPSEGNIKKVTLDEFRRAVQSGEVAQIEVMDDRLNITLIDDTEQYAFKEPGSTIDELLENVPAEIRKDVSVEIVPTDGQRFWTDLILSIIPFIFIAGFLIFMMRQAQNSTNQAMSFGKSKARMADKDKPKATFKDVAGAQEAKEELIEVVDFLKNPTKYTNMGAKIPKGVLLIGAPGTGKTLLARAVAGEAGVPFFNISGSEFVEMFVGVGASRVRDLFKKAKRNAPCIVFIDEIDAVGRQRGAGLGGGNDEREQTLNQILTEMDGFEQGTNVIVMAATNRPDVLDPALMRPGRFDRRIIVDKPDINAREEILKLHSRGKKLAKDADLRKVAARTANLTGADLENIMNEAAIFAAREDNKSISMNDLDRAFEKVYLGPERKSRVMSMEEKTNTAYHELGHAILGHVLPKCDPIHKVSIIPQGMAGGVTWSLPEDDTNYISKGKFLDSICMALGGYLAEEIFFGEMDRTTGASDDLQKATSMARQMVTQYGMSPLGATVFGEPNREVFLGRDYGHVRNYSEEMASAIDKEVSNIINEQYERGKKMVTDYKDVIDEMAQKLLKKEAFNRKQFLRSFDEATEGNKKLSIKLPESKKK